MCFVCVDVILPRIVIAQRLYPSCCPPNNASIQSGELGLICFHLLAFSPQFIQAPQMIGSVGYPVMIVVLVYDRIIECKGSLRQCEEDAETLEEGSGGPAPSVRHIERRPHRWKGKQRKLLGITKSI